MCVYCIMFGVCMFIVLFVTSMIFVINTFKKKKVTIYKRQNVPHVTSLIVLDSALLYCALCNNISFIL